MRRRRQVHCTNGIAQSSTRLPAHEGRDIWADSSSHYCKVERGSDPIHSTTSKNLCYSCRCCRVDFTYSYLTFSIARSMERHWHSMSLQVRNVSIRKCSVQCPLVVPAETTLCCKAAVRVFPLADWEPVGMEIIMESIPWTPLPTPLAVCIDRAYPDPTLEWCGIIPMKDGGDSC